MANPTISLGFIADLRPGEKFQVDPLPPPPPSSSSPSGAGPSSTVFQAMISTIFFVQEGFCNMVGVVGDSSTTSTSSVIPPTDKNNNNNNNVNEMEKKKKKMEVEEKVEKEEEENECVRVSLVAFLRREEMSRKLFPLNIASAQFLHHHHHNNNNKSKQADKDDDEERDNSVKKKKEKEVGEVVIASRLRVPLVLKSTGKVKAEEKEKEERKKEQQLHGYSSKEEEEEGGEEGGCSVQCKDFVRIDHLEVQVERVDEKTGASRGVYEGSRRFLCRLSGVQDTTLTTSQLELLLSQQEKKKGGKQQQSKP